MRRHPWQLLCALGACLLLARPVAAAHWYVSPPTSVVIDTSAVAVAELSGIAYLGPSATANRHRFVAVQDEGGRVVTLELELSPAGQLLAASSIASLAVAASLDFEGVAYTDTARNSVFLSEENAPGVREYDLVSGAELQSVTIPGVFANRRNNFGFESLARNPAGTIMWTGNEEALTVDGPRATTTAGTTVRLLKFNVDGDAVSAGEQYAYAVDPIHTAGFASQRRSGLADLVALPDGTLLALERSFDVSLAAPLYVNRIFAVDFAPASDVSATPLDGGLIGQSFTPVDKDLLWSGTVAGTLGQNLEGLTLGPRLTNGNWLLVGVVDNSQGEDGVSANTLVTFELTPHKTGDFDDNGVVDGRDFLAWQRGFGTVVGATLAQGDADRDGDVDGDDLAFWSAAYGESNLAVVAVPEPVTWGAAIVGLLAAMPIRRFTSFRGRGR